MVSSGWFCFVWGWSVVRCSVFEMLGEWTFVMVGRQIHVAGDNMHCVIDHHSATTTTTTFPPNLSQVSRADIHIHAV